jgi:hypothetical protein
LNLICPASPKAAELNASSETAAVQVRNAHKMFVYEKPLDKEAESLFIELKEDGYINRYLKACILGTIDITERFNYIKNYGNYSVPHF